MRSAFACGCGEGAEYGRLGVQFVKEEAAIISFNAMTRDTHLNPGDVDEDKYPQMGHI